MLTYIKAADGTTSQTAAEKIEINYLESLNTNPFLPHRLSPSSAEGRNTGGGIYKFRTPLAIELPTRQGGATSNAVNYDGLIGNTEIELTVSNPYVTKAYPMDSADVTQLDGISYSRIVTDNITQSLVAVEIENDVKAVLENADILVVDGSAATTALDKLKFMKKCSSEYFAIKADNAYWAAATSATKAFDYFVGVKSYKREQLRFHVAPGFITELSDAVLDAGAGSDLQFKQTENGLVPVVNGITVIENPYLDNDTVLMLPLEMIGTPDIAVMTTEIVVGKDTLNFIEAARGRHFYDSVLVAPELVSKISFAAPVRSTRRARAQEAEAEVVETEAE